MTSREAFNRFAWTLLQSLAGLVAGLATNNPKWGAFGTLLASVLTLAARRFKSVGEDEEF